jgi:hypothetical protein
MKKDLHEIYNLEKIEFLMNNKSKITEDILTELRSYGLGGKQLALEILELKEDETIQDIHCIEIEKCRNDIMYFKDNYILILSKDKLQDNMINSIKKHNSVHLTSALQSKKTYAAVIYALWVLNFQTNKTIGVSASKSMHTKDIISNITNLYNFIPCWMKIKSRNLKTSMRTEMNTSVVTSLVNANAFRGMSLDLLIIDCLELVKPEKFSEFKDAFIPTLSLNEVKIIYIGSNSDINVNADIEINEYTEFEEPLITELPILRETFYSKIKRFFKVLFSKIG